MDRNPTPLPVISIVMTAYQHERFIRSAVASCLAQTFSDFELIVVNDGSTDGTSATVREFHDPRLVLIEQENAGPSLALNAGIMRARGQYLAFMSGDDVSLPTRLERQLEACRRNGEAVVFSHVQFIEETGHAIPTPEWATDVFNIPPLSRPELIRRFIESGNCLAAPSAFMPREILSQQDPLNPCLFQLQDFELWTRLVTRRPFVILEEPLIQYRVHDKNLSRPSSVTNHVTQSEAMLVYRAFLRDLSRADFDAISGMAPREQDGDSEVSLKLDKAFYLRQFEQPFFSVIATELIFEALESPEGRFLARERYGYTPVAFFSDLKGKTDVDQFSHSAPLHAEVHRLRAENRVMRERLDHVTVRMAERLLQALESKPAFQRLLLGGYRPLKKVASRLVRVRRGLAKYGLKFSVAFTQARLAARMGPAVQAHFLEVAHRAYAFHPLANAHLADLHYAQGNLTKARALYVRAFLGDPFLFMDHPRGLRQVAAMLRQESCWGGLRFVSRRLLTLGSEPDLLDAAGLGSASEPLNDVLPLASEIPPHRFFQRTMTVEMLDAWLLKHPGECVQFYGAKDFSFGLPKVYGEPDAAETYTVETPPSFLATVHQVVVGPGFTVLSPEANRLIIYEPASHPKFGHVAGLRGLMTALPGNPNAVRLGWKAKRSLRLPEAILLSGRCSANFYHWLIEYLPRVKEIEAHGKLGGVPVLVSDQMPLQHYEALSLVLGSDYPLIYLDSETLAEVETLHIPSFSTYVPDDFESPFWKAGGTSKPHIDFMRERVLPKVQDVPGWGKRIFISRARNAGRGMTNELAIVEACRRAGFTVVFPELMSFHEQVACFQHADVIMGPTGASFSNVIFCKPGTRIYGLTSERNKTFCNFANLALVAGGDFINVTGPNDRPASEFATHEEFAHSSFSVPLEKIGAILASLQKAPLSRS